MSGSSSNESSSPSFFRVVTSVLASFFGVQSSKRRNEDFTRGKPSHYLFVGLVLTVVFVLAVWGIVSLVLRLATPG